MRDSHAPYVVALVLAVLAGGFVVWLLGPLNTLFWGNVGDESYLIAGMQAVRERGWFHDFFYPDFLPFFPPLYFWAFGTLTLPFVASGIGAAKAAAAATHAACFLAPLLFVKKNARWAAVLAPLIVFLALDYDALLLKPFEVLAAVVAPFWLLAAAEAVSDGPLTRKRVAFLGVTGGLLFLLYHFWWFFLIPALLLTVVTADARGAAFRRLAAIGAVVALVASPYLVPALSMFFVQQTEPWQALYLTLSDLMPWKIFSRGPELALALGGFGALWSLRRERRLAPLASLLAVIVLWYLVNLIMFYAGGRPVLPSKAFLFLGGATLAVSVAFVILSTAKDLFSRTENRSFASLRMTQGLLLLAIGIGIALTPPFRFLPKQKVIRQLEIDRRPQGTAYVAENVRAHVSDYLDRTWLTSGIEDLNGYVSLRHYLAHNQHFSHPASRYSVRLENVKALTAIDDPYVMTAALDRLGIDAAILFKGLGRDGTHFHPLDFHVDDWPNGSKDLELRLSVSAFPPAGWSIVHEDDDWLYLAKNSP